MYENEYASENTAAEVDERLQLMRQYVDLDREQKRMNHERKAFEERAQKLAAEFRQVSERLRGLLGWDESVVAMKRDLDAEFGVRR